MVSSVVPRPAISPRTLTEMQALIRHSTLTESSGMRPSNVLGPPGESEAYASHRTAALHSAPASFLPLLCKKMNKQALTVFFHPIF